MYSNTTNVKVKLMNKIVLSPLLTNSNTTNVKVKLCLEGTFMQYLQYSNTTNVKVKHMVLVKK